MKVFVSQIYNDKIFIMIRLYDPDNWMVGDTLLEIKSDHPWFDIAQENGLGEMIIEDSNAAA
jgi:hypothetical protein